MTPAQPHPTPFTLAKSQLAFAAMTVAICINIRHVGLSVFKWQMVGYHKVIEHLVIIWSHSEGSNVHVHLPQFWCSYCIHILVLCRIISMRQTSYVNDVDNNNTSMQVKFLQSCKRFMSDMKCRLTSCAPQKANIRKPPGRSINDQLRDRVTKISAWLTMLTCRYTAATSWSWSCLMSGRWNTCWSTPLSAPLVTM